MSKEIEKDCALLLLSIKLLQIICPTIKFHGPFIYSGAQFIIRYFEINLGFRVVHPFRSRDSVVNFISYRIFDEYGLLV